MIYVIVGPSHAGKTSFTMNSFMQGDEVTYSKDIVGVTKCGDNYLIGNYLVEKRAKGSDTVARQEVKFIADQVIKLASEGKTVVLEGDKICSHPLLDRLIDENLPVKLYYIRCSIETSKKRNVAWNSTVNDGVLKRVATKAKNIYLDYYKQFDGEILDTDTIEDVHSISVEKNKGDFKHGYYTNDGLFEVRKD